MLFDAKKLELEAADELFQCRIATVKPYVLMLSPIYVFMKRNQKFVSVKAPLDFFTPSELETLAPYEDFFIPKNVSAVSGFQTAAKISREMIRAANAGFPPAPYELSDQLIRVLGPLWGKSLRVSAFCSAIFADEFCGPIEPQELLLGRDTAVVQHEKGLLLSGMLIFTLVHLGWNDSDLLMKLRSEVYSRTIRGEEWEGASQAWEFIARDVSRLIDLRVDLCREGLSEVSSQWVHELGARLTRISEASRTFEGRGQELAVGGFSW